MKVGSAYCQLPPRGIAVPAVSGGGAAAPGAIVTPWENRLRVQAASYLVGSGTAATQTINFYAHNPSPRLRWKLTATWEIRAGGVYARGAGSPLWTLTAVRRSAQSGVTSDLNNIFTSRALPDGYELDSAVEDVRGTLTLNPTDLATALAADFIIEATWVPNGPVDEQVAQLIRQGGLQVIGLPPSIQNTS